MNTYTKALAIMQELECLEKAFHEIESKYNPGIDDQDTFRLTYIYKSMRGGQWHICDMEAMKYISEILERHDNEIRRELAERIFELKKQMKEL